MGQEIEIILNYINEKRRVDFSGYRLPMIEKRINNRLTATESADNLQYLGYLEKNPEELNNLINELIINVSSFFRNTITFEFIDRVVLPAIFKQKRGNHGNSLRVWSAGCSNGEEPYSVAILINELMEKENFKFDPNIFATDISEAALRKALDGTYQYESIKEIKYSILKKYFIINDETYEIIQEIKKMVIFSVYDIIDKKTYIPPESVFGNFDLVLCRNLLIYFKPEVQETIFDKLFRSLAQNGFLILGESEGLPMKYQKYFQKENEYSRIYRKI